MDSLTRMAAKVDAQNAGDPVYDEAERRIATRRSGRRASWCSRGVAQPNGYTEPLLHSWRARKKMGR